MQHAWSEAEPRLEFGLDTTEAKGEEGDQTDAREEVSGTLAVAGRDAPEILEPTEATFTGLLAGAALSCSSLSQNRFVLMGQPSPIG